MKTQNNGSLTLIPTPISSELEIHPFNRELLLTAYQDDSLLLIEDLKPSRQRWRQWDLPREAIEKFICYNEQTWAETLKMIMPELNKGRNAIMMSDGGLPVICDPGRELVYQLRLKGIDVNCGQFDNSILSALAMSGFHNNQFLFLGFPPRQREERVKYWKAAAKKNETLIIMDTAYRFGRVKEELSQYFSGSNRDVFIGFEINSSRERHYWGNVSKLNGFNLDEKLNFVLCVNRK